MVREAFKNQFREMTSGELAFNDAFGKVLPLNIYVRLKRQGVRVTLIFFCINLLPRQSHG